MPLRHLKIMNLSSYRMIPGRVVSNDDPEKLGRIKFVIDGRFSVDGGVDVLPWAYPMGQSFTGSHRTMQNDSIVYILNSEYDNPWEFYYIDISDRSSSLIEILNDSYEETEVLISRDVDGYPVQIYFSVTDGLKLRKDDATIKFQPEGNIEISNGWENRTIDICPDSISLGSVGGSKEPAVMGEQNMKALSDIYTILAAISDASKLTPYTASIGIAIDSLLPGLQSQIPKTLSDNVTLD